MKKEQKLWRNIQKAEQVILSASPKQAAKLTRKIVKWREQVFDQL